MSYDTKCKTCDATEGLYHRVDGSYCLDCFKKLPKFEMNQRVKITGPARDGFDLDIGREGFITHINGVEGQSNDIHLYRVKIISDYEVGGRMCHSERSATYPQDSLDDKSL